MTNNKHNKLTAEQYEGFVALKRHQATQLLTVAEATLLLRDLQVALKGIEEDEV